MSGDFVNETAPDPTQDLTHTLVCIECGCPAVQLYRSYGGDITKISHCNKCNNIVDKYVEFDPVIVLLDCLLLKIQAFRHVLHNTNIQNEWKLTFLFLLCDAYYQLHQNKSPTPAHLPHHLLYSALEWDLYLMFFSVSLELFLCTAVITTIINTTRTTHTTPSTRHTTRSTYSLIQALLISNYGKLFVIPVMLWGQPYSPVYQWIITIFIVLSNAQALRAYRHSRLVSGIAVMSGHVTQLFISSHLHHYLNT